MTLAPASTRHPTPEPTPEDCGNLRVTLTPHLRCRHCEALNPHLQQLVGEVSRDELTVAKIDATEERALATRFSIRAYPTLFFLIDGRVYPYHHPRTVEAFRGFLSQGHKEAQALSMLSSPFGPVGRARALVSTVGQRLVNLSE
mmetsp:Transcript_43433/g.136144  ORF Transcript_43433/g.136144 Transcript_43433/m.136144 type:complete len:144 (-) Transcript_43433:417-848(-)